MAAAKSMSEVVLCITTEHETIFIDSLSRLEWFLNQGKHQNTSVVYSYQESIPIEFLSRLYTAYKDDFKHFVEVLPPGCQKDQNDTTIEGANYMVLEHKCLCESPTAVQACQRAGIQVTFSSLSIHRVGTIAQESLRRVSTFFDLKADPTLVPDKSHDRRPEIREQGSDIVMSYDKYMGIKLAPMSCDCLILRSAENVYCFKMLKGEGSSKMWKGTLEDHLRKTCEDWAIILEHCKRFLSITNREVLDESEGMKLDSRKLLRKLFKTARIWETFRERHRHRLQCLQKCTEWAQENNIRNDWAYGFIKAPLMGQFDNIKRDIAEDLVEETRHLIERTHNILAIDEAYLSREQNQSLKRLSWITFIFLPLLFVASLYGMNVDLLEDNPSWKTYFYLAVPLFVGILLTTRALKWLASPTEFHGLTKQDWIIKVVSQYLLSKQSDSSFEPSDHKSGAPSSVDAKVIHAVDSKQDSSKLKMAAKNGWITIIQDNMSLIAQNPTKREELYRIALTSREWKAAALLRSPQVTSCASDSLIEAVKDRNHEQVSLLLACGVDVNALSTSGSTALHIAITNGFDDIAWTLLKHGVDINILSTELGGGKTSLAIAIKDGNSALVNMLMRFGADIGIEMADGRTALHDAIDLKDSSDILLALITAGADVTKLEQPYQIKLCSMFAEYGHIPSELSSEQLRLIFDLSIINSVYNGSTPLHTAASRGNTIFIKMLLDYGANIDAITDETSGKTALSVAAKLGKYDSVCVLLDKGANIELCSPNGPNPLQAAISAGHSQVIKLLLDRGANPACVHSTAWRNESVLVTAARNGHTQGLTILLEHCQLSVESLELNLPGEKSLTPLEAACEAGHIDIVRLFLLHGARIRGIQYKRNIPGIVVTCDSGSNTHSDYVTPLSLALKRGHLDIMRVLIQNRANVNDCMDGCPTLLQTAIHEDQYDATELLLESGADINSTDATVFDGLSPMEMVARKNDAKVFQLILDTRTQQNPNIGHPTTINTIYVAVINNNLSIAHIFLRDMNRVTPVYNEVRGAALVAASYSGNQAIFDHFVQEGVPVNRTYMRHAQRFHTGERTPLQAAAEGGQRDMVEELLKRGAKINVCSCKNNKFGTTALGMVAERGLLEMVILLLQNGADVNEVHDCSAYATALQLAAYGGHIDVMQRLMDAKADVNAPASKSGKTALQAAIEKDHPEAVQALLERGADFIASIPGESGKTPMQLAVLRGNLRIIKLLAKKGAKINTSSKEYRTMEKMKPACGNGSLRDVQKYLSTGTSIVWREGKKEKRNALQEAVANGRYDIAELLLAYSSALPLEKFVNHVYVTGSNRYTALDLVNEEVYPNLSKLLVAHGALRATEIKAVDKLLSFDPRQNLVQRLTNRTGSSLSVAVSEDLRNADGTQTTKDRSSAGLFMDDFS